VPWLQHIRRGWCGAAGKPTLTLAYFDSAFGVDAQVVAEEQRELLGEAAGPTHVDVRPSEPRLLAKVALGQLWVVGPPHEPTLFDLQAVVLDELDVGHRHLHIDDRFGIEPGDGRGSDVVDAKRDASQLAAEPLGESSELPWLGDC
jgi:hypothetical protein